MGTPIRSTRPVQLLPPCHHPAPPGLRGQQQLYLQFCGLNGDPRGAEDEVEGDLGQSGMRGSGKG